MIDLPLPPNHHASAVLFLAVLALWLFTRKNLTLETASFRMPKHSLNFKFPTLRQQRS